MDYGSLARWLKDIVSGETNISFYTLPVAWMLCVVPRLFAITTYAASTGKPFEFGHPRNLRQLAGSDPALSSRTRGRIIRAEAAAQDTVESAPYFAVAMLAGNQAGLPSSLLNALSVAYLATRIAYIDAYIYSETLIVASLRATLFSIGHMIIWSVFVVVGLRNRTSVA